MIYAQHCGFSYSLVLELLLLLPDLSCGIKLLTGLECFQQPLIAAFFALCDLRHAQSHVYICCRAWHQHGVTALVQQGTGTGTGTGTRTGTVTVTGTGTGTGTGTVTGTDTGTGIGPGTHTGTGAGA